MLAVISQAREIWSLCALNLAFGFGYGDIIVMYAYIVWEYSPSGATR